MLFCGNCFLSYSLCNLFNKSFEEVIGTFLIQVLYLSKLRFFGIVWFLLGVLLLTILFVDTTDAQ